MLDLASYPSSDAFDTRRDSLTGKLDVQLTGYKPYERGTHPHETNWDTWLLTMLARYMTRKDTGQLVPFGEHHVDFWTWVWALSIGVMPRPFVGIWPRGAAKSTSAEMAGAMVGALQMRRYVLYVCETMDRAEDHVQNVAGMFESPLFERFYSHVAHPLVSKVTGASKGWKRNRLRTSSGFTVDAIGLDVAARGVKLDDVRPDMMVFDDLDGEDDGPKATQKKINTITKKFLPAGSNDLAVLMVQNLIIPNGIFSRLADVADEPADFLHERKVSGPFPAVRDLEYELRGGQYVITRGRPIWAGMNLEDCQRLINREGITAFLTERQQEVQERAGGMFDHLVYRHCDADEVPDLVRIEAWVDPAVTDTDQSDSHGIQIDGVDSRGILYRLYSWEHRASPEKVLVLAICKAVEYGASAVGVETNQGGDLWRSTYQHLTKELAEAGVEIDGIRYRLPKGARIPAFKSERAGGAASSKQERAGRMLVAYERDRIVHVRGTHQALETALHRFPLTKPFDLTDAAYWAWHSLADGSDLPFAWLRSNPETNAILTGNAMPVRGADPVGEALGNIAPATTNEDRIAARKAAYLASLPD